MMPPKHTLEVELGSKIFVRKYFARQIDLDPHSRPKPTIPVQNPENRRTSKVPPKDFRSIPAGAASLAVRAGGRGTAGLWIYGGH